ncbi:MAG TPA: methionine biosynthesis protein MetW [Rickettsiales bacterium]|nr:methionine biosynthesis protein MetW [Rickettsiales bacterium]
MTLRPALKVIADFVPEGSKVLDIGCGDGELLSLLASEKKVDGRGLELSQSGVNAAIAKGICVVQGDADTDLQYYPDKAYDYVILSQTLQTMRAPKEVLANLVRIGKHAIVSVPNFGYWKNRAYLGFLGRMPVTKTLSYQWHDTPNIHFCTLTDFVELCDLMHITIDKRVYIDDRGMPSYFQGKGMFANLFGEEGIFVLHGN